jgi:phage baseplate assembly protein W
MADLDTPQFDLPSREEIGDSVEVLLRTPLGFYEDQPDYGVEFPLFEEEGSDGTVPMDEVQTAITTWEDRADPLIDAEPDLLDVFVNRVTINTRARTADA